MHDLVVVAFRTIREAKISNRLKMFHETVKKCCASSYDQGKEGSSCLRSQGHEPIWTWETWIRKSELYGSFIVILCTGCLLYTLQSIIGKGILREPGRPVDTYGTGR